MDPSNLALFVIQAVLLLAVLPIFGFLITTFGSPAGQTSYLKIVFQATVSLLLMQFFFSMINAQVLPLHPALLASPLICLFLLIGIVVFKVVKKACGF